MDCPAVPYNYTEEDRTACAVDQMSQAESDVRMMDIAEETDETYAKLSTSNSSNFVRKLKISW